jgi:hypothetical protein
VHASNVALSSAPVNRTDYELIPPVASVIAARRRRDWPGKQLDGGPDMSLTVSPASYVIPAPLRHVGLLLPALLAIAVALIFALLAAQAPAGSATDGPAKVPVPSPLVAPVQPHIPGQP